MQLRDVPELDCYTGGKNPAGQIYVKGNSVFAGYFKNPKMTMETVDADGWLRVGDVGKLLPNGAIVLIDRVKEVIKTQNGQFVAPARLEAIYVNVPLVNQIYIDINSKYSFIVAVVTVVEEKLKQYADVNGLEGEVETLITMNEVKFGVLKQLERAWQLNSLAPPEKVHAVHIALEPFSAKNGLLTPTMKMKRIEIRQRYKDDIDRLYRSHAEELVVGEVGFGQP